MTIYVLEGPDGAGKSTLAERIAARTQVQRAASGHFGETTILHNGPLPANVNAFEHYMKQLTDWRESTHYSEGSDLIIDRLHVGELIYGPMYRNESRLTEEQARAIDQFIDEIGGVLIYVTAPNNVLKTRVNTRGDDLVTDLNHLDTIASRYSNYVHNVSPVRWTVWDTTLHGRIF